MNVVKETMFRHQESIRLERTLQTSVWLDPLIGSRSALFLPQFAPIVDLDIVAALYDVGDVSLGINFFTIFQDLDLIFLTGCFHVGV